MNDDKAPEGEDKPAETSSGLFEKTLTPQTPDEELSPDVEVTQLPDGSETAQVNVGGGKSISVNLHPDSRSSSSSRTRRLRSKLGRRSTDT
ncbi:MAG: hypothetical protein M3331_00245 [Actinomycetota bacterium]|nr:hypothetical protein [Actinomycetota bacterium]